MLGEAVAVRLTDDQLQKLDQISRRTRRSRADVLRMLVDAAIVPPQVEVKLNQRRIMEACDGR